MSRGNTLGHERKKIVSEQAQNIQGRVYLTNLLIKQKQADTLQ
jgi:hypothetical protein